MEQEVQSRSLSGCPELRMLLRDMFDGWMDDIDPTVPICKYLEHPHFLPIVHLVRECADSIPFLVGLLHSSSRYGILAMALLQGLTGENPVPVRYEDDACRMRTLWEQWAQSRRIEPLLVEFDRQIDL